MSIPKNGDGGANSDSEGKKHQQAAVVPESAISNPRIKTVIHFLEANFQRRISSTELANVANLSSSHLSHLFKSETGLSPVEYLRRLRMQRASHLLATTLLSIKQIMAVTGHDDRSIFVRHFKRYFDATPSEYRRSAYKSRLADTKRRDN